MSWSRFAAVTTLLAAACGGHYRTEPVGRAHTSAAAGQAASARVEVDGDHRLQVEVAIALPRAQQVAYAVACPAGAREGQVGEPWEQYRARRLAELERARQAQVDTAAAVAGAVLGRVEAGAGAAGPGGRAEVHAEADGRALGAAAADGALAEPELPPGDTGARVERLRFTFGPGTGACSLRLWPADGERDLRGVTATLDVAALVDLDREKKQLRARAVAEARGVRGEVIARLAATGADPHRRARLRAEARARAEAERARADAERRARDRAEAERRARADAERARAEAERRARADAERARQDAARRARLEAEAEERRRIEAKARLEAEQRARVEAERRRLALVARGELVAYLAACGGDPHRRARLRAEAEARAEAERQRRLRAEAEARQRRLAAEAEARQRRLAAEAEARERRQRALRGAVVARERLVATLIGLGADPEYRRKQNEAELRAYEARLRSRREEELRRQLAAAEVEVEIDAPASTSAVVTAAPARSARVDLEPPAPPTDARPPRPSATSVWIEGRYELAASGWRWHPGRWTEPPAAGAIWVPPIEVVVRGSIVARPGSWRDAGGRRVRRVDAERQRPRRRVRDHR